MFNLKMKENEKKSTFYDVIYGWLFQFERPGLQFI